MRAQLADALPLALAPVTTQTSTDGATTKWLWRAADGAQVETVLMGSDDRATVCVSSQAGCAMGCTFCATGQAGFERHLDAGEIVEQVIRGPARDAATRVARGVHGHGRAAGERRQRLRRARALPRPTSASPRVT